MTSFFKEMKRNREALAYSVVGFIFGLLLVRFGIFKTTIILLFTIIPFYMYKNKRNNMNNWTNSNNHNRQD